MREVIYPLCANQAVLTVDSSASVHSQTEQGETIFASGSECISGGEIKLSFKSIDCSYPCLYNRTAKTIQVAERMDAGSYRGTPSW